MIRVLIVEDEPALARGLSLLLIFVREADQDQEAYTCNNSQRIFVHISILTTTKTDGIFPLPITERLSRRKSFPIYAARLPALLLPEIRIWITSPFSGIRDMVWKIPFSAFISTITVKNISMFPEMKMNRPP